MKANHKREDEAWKALPKKIREAIAKFVFISAIKSNTAVLLFRCEQKHWKKEHMKALFYDLVSLYQMTFFGQSISDNDLIERYEKMLDIDFGIFDTAVEVRTE